MHGKIIQFQTSNLHDSKLTALTADNTMHNSNANKNWQFYSQSASHSSIINYFYMACTYVWGFSFFLEISTDSISIFFLFYSNFMEMGWLMMKNTKLRCELINSICNSRSASIQPSSSLKRRKCIMEEREKVYQQMKSWWGTL